VPTETVLVEVVTAANMAGIEEAKAGMLGLSASTLGLAAVFGVMYVVIKASVENLKKQEGATLSLKQATDAQHISLGDLQAAYEKFKATNAGFISDQYDTEAALAAVVRSGENQTDALRILNDALDLAAIKHETVSEAANAEVLALAGASRGLKTLGITTEEYNAIMKDKLLTTEQKHLELLTLIETRTAKGRDTIDQTTQSQNKLTIAWQDFTANQGPAFTQVWQQFNLAAADSLGFIDAAITNLDRLGRFLDQYHLGHASTGSSAGSSQLGGRSGANPNYVAPSGDLHIHIDQGAYMDPAGVDRLANQIMHRVLYGPGT
jgi:hypothetical protein